MVSQAVRMALLLATIPFSIVVYSLGFYNFAQILKKMDKIKHAFPGGKLHLGDLLTVGVLHTLAFLLTFDCALWFLWKEYKSRKVAGRGAEILTKQTSYIFGAIWFVALASTAATTGVVLANSAYATSSALDREIVAAALAGAGTDLRYKAVKTGLAEIAIGWAGWALFTIATLAYVASYRASVRIIPQIDSQDNSLSTTMTRVDEKDSKA